VLMSTPVFFVSCIETRSRFKLVLNPNEFLNYKVF
jgi:hypothetical protein